MTAPLATTAMKGEPIDMSVITTPAAVGNERFRSERRQIGGLMLLLGTCVAFQPLANIASLIGTDDDDEAASTPLERASLAAGFCQVAFGGMSMMVGYLSLVHTYGNANLSAFLILLTQMAWVPFITNIVTVGKDAFGTLPTDFVISNSSTTITTITTTIIFEEEFVVNPFIPSIYLPNERDVHFFGAMGILGYIAYGVAFFGSLAFTEFTLYAFDMNNPMARNAEYYRGRLLFYTLLLVLAGMSQLLLGAYSLTEYGNGPLEPPLVVAMYTISFPEISITLGILQMLVGYFGLARYLGSVPVGPKDHEYQVMLLVHFILMIGLQYLTQIGYAPDDQGAATGTGTGTIISLVLLSVGLNMLPAFLDYKMRTMPQQPVVVTKEYFGITSFSGGAKPKGGIGIEKLEPAGGFVPLAGSVSSNSSDSSSLYLNDIEEAIQHERNLDPKPLGGEESSEEDNSGWEDTTDSSGAVELHPMERPKPLVWDEEAILSSVPNEANDKDISFDGGNVKSAPMAVPMQMSDDEDEVLAPYDEDEEDEEGNGRPPVVIEEEVILPGDMDDDDDELYANGRPPVVVEEEVIIGEDGEVVDDGEHSQDPSEDNTPPASNQSKEWDDTAGWVDQVSLSGSDNSNGNSNSGPIRKRSLSIEDPPDIKLENNNTTRSDASPDINLVRDDSPVSSPPPDPKSRDEVGVKKAEPEQVIAFSNLHHDEDESDDDEEYTNDMQEIFSMIDPPEVRTPVNVKQVSYPKSNGTQFPFGEDDIQDTASVVSMSGSDDSSEPGDRHAGDDSMAALNKRLEDIEKELFTHSMDAYNKSLEEIF
jgi:hypothetical protein